MPDLAELNLVVKSQQVKEANEQLNQLSAAGEKAEKRTEALAGSAGKLDSSYTHLTSTVVGFVGGQATGKLLDHTEKLHSSTLKLDGTYAGLGNTLTVLGGYTAAELLGTTQELNNANEKGGKVVKDATVSYSDLTSRLVQLVGVYTALRTAVAAVQAAAEHEATGIVFTKLLGSAELSKQLLGELQRIADDSTLEFPHLVVAARRMASLGMQASEIPKVLSTIGEAASVLGVETLPTLTEAFAKMSSGARITMREMQMLQMTGIPAWKMLATVLNVTVAEAMEKVERGAISGRTASAAFLSEFERRYGGTMKELDSSTHGLIGSLVDNLKLMLRSLGQGITDAFNVSGVLQGVVSKTGEWRDLLGDVVRVLLGLNPQFEQTAKLAREVANWIRTIGSFVGVLLAVVGVVKLFTAAVWALNVALVAIQRHPLVFLIAAIAAGIVYLNGRTSDATEEVGNLADSFDNLGQSITQATGPLGRFMDKMVDVLKLGPEGPRVREVTGGRTIKEVDEILAKAEEARNDAMLKANEARFSDPSYIPANAQQRRAYRAWKQNKAMGEGGGAGIADNEEYLRAQQQLKQMQVDLDTELTLIGATSEAREIAAAKLRIERLQLQGVDEQTKKYIATLEELQKARKLEDVAKGIGDAFAQNFEDAILAAKTFGEAIKSIIMEVNRVILQAFVTKPLAQGITSMITNAFMGGVSPGIEGVRETQGWLHGTPDFSSGEFGAGAAAGHATAAAELAGGGRRVRGGNVTVHIHANDVNSFRASKQQVANDVRQIFRRA